MSAELDEVLGECGSERRDFLAIASGSVAGLGLVCAFWPLVNSMAPSASVLAQSSAEVNLDGIKKGQVVKVKWQGKPVFIRRRTEEEVKALNAQDISSMRDPESDASRVKKSEWLIILGICTHLGCVPLYKAGDNGGGWICPCHGSYYDASGRILRGPAPKNMKIPEYYFASDKVVVIGRSKEV